MNGTLQTKMQGPHQSRLFEIFLIILVSFLLIDKRIPTTNDEMEFLDNIKSYANRRFKLYKHLPLPALVYYGLHHLSTFAPTPLVSLILRNHRLINFVLFAMTMLEVSWLSQQVHSNITSWMTVTTFIIGLSTNSQIILFTNDLFSVLFAVAGITQLKKGCNLISGVLFGLSISSSWISLSVLPPLAIFHAVRTFSFVVDPRNRISRALTGTIRAVTIFVLIPTSVYLLSFFIHHAIQSNYSEDANGFSIEFKSTLRTTAQEPADKYLMDRSVVTILNQKLDVYLNMRNNIPSCSDIKSEDSLWVVIKIHLNESGDSGVEEEDRYVKHGDLVKIVGLHTSMCLRVVTDDKDEKFKKVLAFPQHENSAEEEDIWQVIGSGNVISRSSLIRFRHYKTAMDLCVRDLRGGDEGSAGRDVAMVVNGSQYSANDSRLFYISDNRNHEFFRRKFEDGRPRQRVQHFPQKNFLQKMLEYHTKLLEMSEGRWSLFGRHSQLPLSGDAYYLIENDVFFNVFTAMSSFLFPVLLLISHIAHRKYGWRSVRGDDIFVCATYLCATLIELMLKTNQTFTVVLRIWMALSLMSFLGARPASVLLSIIFSSSTR